MIAAGKGLNCTLPKFFFASLNLAFAVHLQNHWQYPLSDLAWVDGLLIRFFFSFFLFSSYIPPLSFYCLSFLFYIIVTAVHVRLW